ncbi:MAG TPA: DUF3800 domain-containing protein [Alphaproteobacteria bacterium]|nr:DUF3800 domain-containing protein [Alphaproteobacteria bacterium]
MPASQSKRYLIYADESSHNGQRFMLQSGIILPFENLDQVEKAVAEYRQSENMRAELKWERVASQKYGEYKKFTDYFFSLNNNNELHYKALVIDASKIDNRRFNAGNRELGFFKFYYQLLLHSFGRNYGDKEIHVFLDQKSTSQSLDDFKEILNNGMASRYNNHARPFKLVEFVDSKKHCLSQMNDVILGGLAHRKNGVHLLPQTRQAKKDLSAYILKNSNVTDDVGDTPRRQSRFSVWNFKMS